MTREFLLRAGITEFRDFNNKVLSIPFKRIYTDQGYSYLVLDRVNAKEIECAIHFGREYTITEEIGRLHTSSLDFSTREKVDIPNTLFVYKKMETSNNGNVKHLKQSCKDFTITDDDLIFFAKSYDGYNETMKQFMYSAEALTTDKRGLIEPLHDIYGYTSFDILSKLPNYDILPSYVFAEDKFAKGLILLNIESSEPLSMIDFSSISKDYCQTIFEDVSFNLIHISRKDTMKFVSDLCNYSLSSRKFGIVGSMPKIEEFPDLQEAAALRGQAVKVSLRVCYPMKMSDLDKIDDKQIKEVVWKMSDELGDELTISTKLN